MAVGRSKTPKKLAVVMAHEKETLAAVELAWRQGMVEPILIGDRKIIEENLSGLGLSHCGCRIFHCGDEGECLGQTAALLREGAADAVMKDQIKTGSLMRLFVKKENGFLKKKVLSHIAFNELPCYHKLLCITDTSLNVAPDVEQKQCLIENAVEAMAGLGFDTPKVAVMAAVEYENPAMKETADAAELARRNRAGELKGCIVEGPISLDLAIDTHAAQVKGYKSRVAGDADLLVVPDLASGNLLGKAFNYMPGSQFAGFITGACAPIVLTSRASSPENKFLSVAAACLGR